MNGPRLNILLDVGSFFTPGGVCSPTTLARQAGHWGVISRPLCLNASPLRPPVGHQPLRRPLLQPVGEPPAFTPLSDAERLDWNHRRKRFPEGGLHPMTLLRGALNDLGYTPLARVKAGRVVTASLIVSRQRPPRRAATLPPCS